MQRHETLADGQAEACAAVGPARAAVRLAKLLKDAGLILRRDPHAGVRHGHHQLAVLLIGAHGDRALVGKAGGVVQQVEQHLADARGVDVHPGEVGRDVGTQLQPAHLDEAAGRRHGLGDELGRLHLLEGQLELRGLDARQVEYVVDEALQVVGVAVDDSQVTQVGGRQLPAIVLGRLGHQLGEAEDEVQGGAQLVADGLCELLL